MHQHHRNPSFQLVAALGASLSILAACNESNTDRRDASQEEDADAPGEDAAIDAAEPEQDAAVDGGHHEGEPPRAEFRPVLRPVTDALVQSLSVPEGFRVRVYARELGHARMLSTHEGHVYLTRPRTGDVLMLVDADQDGSAESHSTVASGLMGVHGIAFHGGNVYLATPTSVYRATVDANSGNFGTPALIIDDLPDGGQHPNRTLAVGPDQKLYISVGSSCDACEESNEEHATMLVAELDGSARSTFASGLRNTLGFAWHPATGELWGMDQGSDWRGDDLPPEELNRLQRGQNYGWPFCFADRQLDTIIQEPQMGTKEAFCAMSTPPVKVEQAHGSPIGFVFYAAAQFPAAYLNSAFVTWRGSWNRLPATGYKLARVVFEKGEPQRFEDFVTGFLIEDGKAQFGRPTGLTVAPDGALLFSDDENGYVYRVSYEAAP